MVKARDKSISKSKEAVFSAMKNVLFMAQHDLPNSILQDLNNLCIEQGASHLQSLNVDQHTSYTHNDSVLEFQQAMADAVLDDLVEKVKESDYFSLLIDESTDVAVDQNLIIYVRYLFKGNTKTDFLSIRKLSTGATADKLLDLLIDVVDTLGLNINKMSGIATDGAAVMVGSKSGIVTRLKSLNPAILSTHCIAHRLALGSCGAADQIPYLIKYQEILNCIYKYFENSPKNLNKLKYIQNIMSENGTRFKQISGTRWLSFDGAVQTVLRNYSSLVTVLIEDNTPKIAGLLKSITSIKFLYCTYFLSDVLAVLCRLSKCYQKNDIMFSNVNPLLQSSIDQLKVIASGTSGPNFSKFQNLIPSDIVLDQLGEASFIFEDQLIRDGFKQRGDAQTSCNKFVVNVINNLNARFVLKLREILLY
ncbi:hypothetical protein SNE40_011894 [Patella caerulea]|uniref:DUF4371 domain-containing protein n=1 Tax=Patella caerulea TaxID=87958 RepID=A0AAN8JKE9_PATCE